MVITPLRAEIPAETRRRRGGEEAAAAGEEWGISSLNTNLHVKLLDTSQEKCTPQIRSTHTAKHTNLSRLRTRFTGLGHASYKAQVYPSC